MRSTAVVLLAATSALSLAVGCSARTDDSVATGGAQAVEERGPRITFRAYSATNCTYAASTVGEFVVRYDAPPDTKVTIHYGLRETAPTASDWTTAGGGPKDVDAPKVGDVRDPDTQALVAETHEAHFTENVVERSPRFTDALEIAIAKTDKSGTVTWDNAGHEGGYYVASYASLIEGGGACSPGDYVSLSTERR
jgi:hypothetical protein